MPGEKINEQAEDTELTAEQQGFLDLATEVPFAGANVDSGNKDYWDDGAEWDDSEVDWDMWESDSVTPLSEGELLAREIDSARKFARSRKQERAQEIFERNLNAEMTDIDELKMLAESGVQGLTLEGQEYEGQEVKVIHASGYPLKFLKTNVNTPFVARDPSIWAINGDHYSSFARVEGGGINFDPNSGEASNVICTTYIDTDINPEIATSGGSICYIFTHVRPDSVIDAGGGDIWSSSDDGANNPRLMRGDSFLTPNEIATQSIESGINEVVLRRYDENGNPLLPTAILVHDREELNDNILKTATFFNIPVVHIHRGAYGVRSIWATYGEHK